MENKESLALLREIIMFLSVQVKRGVPHATLIRELSDVGFQPKKIAEIVGTTPNTVRVALYHYKKSSKKKL